MPVGNKRLYILKQARKQKLQVCLSTHDLSLPTCIKWLQNMWNKKHKQNFTILFSCVCHKTVQFLVADMNFIVVFFLSILFFII